MKEKPTGYIVPLHRSLTLPDFWGGVPRECLLFEFILGVMGGLLFKSFIVPIIAVILHFIFRQLGKYDPDFFGVFMRYLKTKPYYWGN